MKGLGKGDKYTASAPLDDGLSSRESINKDAKLRGDTGESQQPTSKTESLKDDQGRGSFKSKC